MLIKFLYLLLLLSFTLYAAEKQNISLQLKWFSSFQFAGYYMAKEKGFYAEENLFVEIKERDMSRNHIEQVLNNESEYGVSDSTLLLYRAVGKPVKILASIFQRSPLIFISKKESGIETPFEMKNKILSYQKGLDDAPLVTLFNEANITENDFQFKQFDFNIKDFIKGNVDVISAYASNEPYLMKELGIAINIINPINYGINFYGDNLFTTENEIKNNPTRVQSFIKASIKGWNYALDNKIETIKVLKEKYNAKNSYNHLLYEAEIIESMIMRDVVDIGHTSLERLRDIANNYVDLGKVTNLESNKAMNGLLYRPSNIENINDYKNYNDILILISILMFFITIIALFINNRLKNRIKNIRFELKSKQNLIDKYMLVTTTNLDGVIISASNALYKLTGFTKDELIGKKHSVFRHPDTPYNKYNQIWSTIESDEIWSGELKNIKKNGDCFWLNMYISPLFDKNNIKTGYISISENITDKKNLECANIKDTITEVYNKRHFDDIFPKFINSAKRNNELISFLIMDIDYFKEYNEIYGVKQGDEILVKVSSLFEKFLHRSDDYKFRISGEEFAILFKCNSKEDAVLIANELRLCIKRLQIKHEKNRASKYLTVSIALYCLKAKEILNEKDVYKQADILLAQAKEKGGNQLITN